MAQTSDKLTFDFEEFIGEDTKMSIILILRIYGSLNLRQIAKVIGISEPSTHVHIKELLERRYIELDNEMAGLRGKYYKIVQELIEALDTGEEQFDPQSAGISERYYHRMANGLRTLSIMSNRFGSYVANYIDEHAKEMVNQLEEKKAQGDEGASLVAGSLSFVKVRNKEQLDEIFDAYRTFESKIAQINEANNDLKDEDSHDAVMISGLIIPMSKLDPREN